jgi:hypothetical protein
MTRKHKAWELVQCLFFRIRDDEVAALGAQLTYYLILAFFPFLIFLVSIVSFVQLSGDDIIWEWIRLLPEDTGIVVTKSVHEVSDDKSQALLSIGMVATIWAASNGINAIRRGRRPSLLESAGDIDFGHAGSGHRHPALHAFADFWQSDWSVFVQNHELSGRLR